MWFPHIAIDFVFALDIVILLVYFLAIRFKWCATVCRSSSDVFQFIKFHVKVRAVSWSAQHWAFVCATRQVM